MMLQGYLDDVGMSFAAVGDVNSDKAPIQVSAFAQGSDLDNHISKMYLEGGGGGGYTESYELSAYFYVKHCQLSDPEIPFFFVTGDEIYYDEIQSGTIKEVMGIQAPALKGEDMWHELMKKFNVFLLKKPYDNVKNDKIILDKWTKTLGHERVLEIVTPKACVDVMLGAIAITSGARTLEAYTKDMEVRGQTKERIAEVAKALKEYDAKVDKKIVRNIVDRLVYPEDVPMGNVDLEEEKKEEGPDDRLKKLRDAFVRSESVKLDEEHKKYREDLREMRRMFEGKIPQEFFCPITGEMFIDPVMTVDGHTYEKLAIEMWLQNHDTSPLTNMKLYAKTLLPNQVFKQLVQDYYESNKDKLVAN